MARLVTNTGVVVSVPDDMAEAFGSMFKPATARNVNAAQSQPVKSDSAAPTRGNARR